MNSNGGHKESVNCGYLCIGLSESHPSPLGWEMRDASRQGRAGQVLAGPGRAGQAQAGPGRVGQGRAGPGKGRQVQAELGRAGSQINSAGWGNGKISNLKCFKKI